jgi:hypothetical protein
MSENYFDDDDFVSRPIRSIRKAKKNTGMYLEHGEFHIGKKFYLINPLRIRSICYDDTPNNEKITLDFNHPDNRLEYYCLDGMQIEWKTIKRDFIKFWQTNARDLEKFIADHKDIIGEHSPLDPALSDIKTCRVYYPDDDFNDGKPQKFTKAEWEAEEKRRIANRKKFYEQQRCIKKEYFDERLKKGEISEEEYKKSMVWLEKRYKFLDTYEEDHKSDINWDGIDSIIESDTM